MFVTKSSLKRYLLNISRRRNAIVVMDVPVVRLYSYIHLITTTSLETRTAIKLIAVYTSGDIFVKSLRLSFCDD